MIDVRKYLDRSGETNPLKRGSVAVGIGLGLPLLFALGQELKDVMGWETQEQATTTTAVQTVDQD